MAALTDFISSARHASLATHLSLIWLIAQNLWSLYVGTNDG